MTAPPPTSPVERFVAILEFFRRGIAVQAAQAARAAQAAQAARAADCPRQAVLRLLWSRICRVAQQFTRLAARIPAGAPPRPHVTRPRVTRLGHPPATPQAPSSARPVPQPWARLPRRPGWGLLVAAPVAYNAASYLRILLAEPDMAALLAASPGLRRSLRPLCRLLGLPQPPAPQPPAHQSPPPPEPASPASGAPSPPVRPPADPPPRPPRVRAATTPRPASSWRPAPAGIPP